MCNYCQTSSVFSNSCCRNAGWRVQRICYDCNGNVYVTVTNGCSCRRLTCGAYQDYQDTDAANNTSTNCNRCRCGWATNTATQGQCAATAQNGDSYYARLYGLNSYGCGRSCCCGN